MLPIGYAIVDLTPCVIHGARHLIKLFAFLNLVVAIYHDLFHCFLFTILFDLLSQQIYIQPS